MEVYGHRSREYKHRPKSRHFLVCAPPLLSGTPKSALEVHLPGGRCVILRDDIPLHTGDPGGLTAVLQLETRFRGTIYMEIE